MYRKINFLYVPFYFTIIRSAREMQLNSFQINCLLAICNWQKAGLSIAESTEPGSRDDKLLITIALITFHRGIKGL
jgi:hypothetical protein